MGASVAVAPSPQERRFKVSSTRVKDGTLPSDYWDRMEQQHPDHQHQVRHVVLPSGKRIEVVFFGETPAQPAHRDLHVCRRCSSQLVYPVEWEEAGATHWEVRLRCPDCEWSDTGVYEQSAVEQFDEELDRGTDALVRDLKRLMQANMEDEVARFVAALNDDLILPEDF